MQTLQQIIDERISFLKEQINPQNKPEENTLQNAPRDEDKLRKLLEIKQRQKEEATHIEDTQRLVTEIEMLKVVSHLISKDN